MEENIVWSDWVGGDFPTYNYKTAKINAWILYIIRSEGSFVGQICGGTITLSSIRFRSEERARRYAEFGYRKLVEAFTAIDEFESDLETEES